MWGNTKKKVSTMSVEFLSIYWQKTCMWHVTVPQQLPQWMILSQNIPWDYHWVGDYRWWLSSIDVHWFCCQNKMPHVTLKAENDSGWHKQKCRRPHVSGTLVTHFRLSSQALLLATMFFQNCIELIHPKPLKSETHLSTWNSSRLSEAARTRNERQQINSTSLWILSWRK
jgi:hypothetical protein